MRKKPTPTHRRAISLAELDEAGKARAQQLNEILRHVIPIGQPISDTIKMGAEFCPYGRMFHVWMPTLAAPAVLPRLNRVFHAWERSSHLCDHLGRPDITQFDAYAVSGGEDA